MQMYTPSAVLALWLLAYASAAPSGTSSSHLAIRDDSTDSKSTAEKVAESIGGGGPPGQSVVRGFFIGIGFGVALGVLCCCWWPCVHGRRRRRQLELRRRTQGTTTEEESAQVEARYEDRDTTTTTTTGVTAARAADGQ